MKVLMVVPNLEIGGLETMVLRLCRGLKRIGVEPSVFGYDFHPGRANLMGLFTDEGIRVESFEKGAGFSPSVVRRLNQIVQADSIDLVHSHDIGPLLYSALSRGVLRGARPHVHTQHTLQSFQGRSRAALKNRVYDRFFSRTASQVIAVSPAIEAHYRSIGVRGVRRIENGVAFAAAPLTDRTEIRALRAELIDSMGDVGLRARLRELSPLTWLVCVARIQEAKGQLDLVRIWNETSAEFRSKHALIFVGQETDQDEARKFQLALREARSSQHIVTTGATLEPLRWMLASDVYVSASHGEGMPLAPLEAIGSGRPAVLSDIEGHRYLEEFVDFISLLDPAGSARILEKVSVRFQMVEGALSGLWKKTSVLRERHGTQSMVNEYMNVYATMFGAGSRGGVS